MTRCLLSVVACVLVLNAPAPPALGQSGAGGGSKPRGRATKSSKKPKTAKSVVSFESRRADWVRRKEAANAAGATGPDPLEQYLVSEVLVTGLFETDAGYGVFLLATPTGNTFFATNGARLFNGRLVSIDKIAGAFADDAQIVFEERSGKGSAQRVVKRVVAAPSKADDPEPAPPADEKPADDKRSTEKPPLAARIDARPAGIQY